MDANSKIEKAEVSYNRNVRNPPRNRFSRAEDNLLRELVNKYGNKWRLIAYEMKTKDERQCRNRWRTYIQPGLIQSPLTDEEIRVLLFWVERCGTNWRTIVHLFPGRTCTFLKNQFVTYCKRFSINRKEYLRMGEEIRKSRKESVIIDDKS